MSCYFASVAASRGGRPFTIVKGPFDTREEAQQWAEALTRGFSDVDIFIAEVTS